MRYPIFDVEVTQSLLALTVSRGDAGVGVLVRRKDRPIAFWIEQLPAKRSLTSKKLASTITKNAKTQMLTESIREELSYSAMQHQFPSLTVAVCTRDRPVLLRRCLESLVDLKRQVNRSRSEFDILVIDNAPSNDQTRKLVTHFSEVRYLSEVKPGLNFARNRAVLETDSELIAYLDDDVVVDRGWLHGLQEAWLDNPDAAAFTGQVLPMELETEAQILFEQRGGFRRGFDKIRYTSVAPIGDEFLYPCRTGIFGVGCNMAFRRQTLIEIGGFDEALDTGPTLPGGGDHDIFYRIIRAGHSLIYEPTFLVFHQHRQTMKKLKHQYWSWGLSVMAFASKAHRIDINLRPKWRKLIAGWFHEHLKELAKAMLGRHVLPIRFLFWELFGGVKGLCGEYNRSKKRIRRIYREHQ